MTVVDLALVGLGNVGRRFVKLLKERQEMLRTAYGLELRLEGAFKSDGGAIREGGLDLTRLVEAIDSRQGLTAVPGFSSRLAGLEGLQESHAHVLVEATPTDIKTGEPGLSHIRHAIARGMHVVSLNKGPFVVAFEELTRAAAERGVELKLSGATAAALPTLDVATYCLAGARIMKIQGIFNGTSNYVLTRMEEGLTFGKALEEAQRLGIAERDPTLDVGGWDTANKLLVLTNVAMGARLRLDDIQVKGITLVSPVDIERAAGRGMTIKLIGEAEVTGTGVTAIVAPVFLPRTHPLAPVTGTTKAIHFETDTMGSLTVIGGKSDPQAAAAAALKDTINLALRARAP